ARRRVAAAPAGRERAGASPRALLVAARHRPDARRVRGDGCMRPAVVYGLLHAGLALSRALGRSAVPVYGLALDRRDFGLRSRYLTGRRVVAADEDVLAALRELRERPVLFPERDVNVAFVLRNWDAVHELAEVPLPDDPDVVRRLRRKERLPEEAAAAGVAAPATVA